jgi:hypothetical protein
MFSIPIWAYRKARDYATQVSSNPFIACGWARCYSVSWCEISWKLMLEPRYIYISIILKHTYDAIDEIDLDSVSTEYMMFFFKNNT